MDIVVSGQRDLDKYMGQSPSFDYFEASLIGLQKLLAMRMAAFIDSPKKVFFSTTADWRSTLLLRKNIKPPFIRLAIRSVALDNTRVNVRAMMQSGIFARYSSSIAAGDYAAAETMLREIKGFPITVNIAGYWIGPDVPTSLKAGIWLTLMSHSTGGLSFILDEGLVSPFEVQVRSDTPEWTTPGRILLCGILNNGVITRPGRGADFSAAGARENPGR
jgi:hypothetical protein